MIAMSLYTYYPNKPIAILAAVLFSGVAGYHTFLFFRLKTFFFFCMLFGVYMELAGLLFRCISSFHPDNVSAFLISYLTIM